MTNLKHIEINIGKACNSLCRFCMSQKSDKKMKKLVDFNYLQEKIITYSKRGYNSIGFLGGDISIYPKLEEVMKVCKESGFINVNLITNGMLFSDYDFAARVVEAGATRINFSIHSHLGEVEDFLTQIPGGFEKKIKAIKNFSKLIDDGILKSPLSVNIVINKQNYKDILKTCIFFKKLQIYDIRINFLRPNKDSIDYYDDILIKYDDILEEIKQLVIFALKANVRITFDSIPPCIFKKVFPSNYKKIIKIFLGEDFDYIYSIDDYNMFEGKNNPVNVNFDWKQRKKDELKTLVKTCEKCIYFNTCEGIRKEYRDIFGDEEFKSIMK